MILLIDNYDSFVHNLARYFQRLGQATIVVRNDEVTSDDVGQDVQAIVFSPGPCTPQEAGNSLQIVQELARRVPMLGVCLGHQTIAAAFGAQIERAREPMHGRTSRIIHDGSGVFAGLANPLTVARYHSLVVNEASLPDELRATARDENDGSVMALTHVHLPVVGLQFHPESILTEAGYQLLAAFLDCAGLKNHAVPDVSSEHRCRPDELLNWPDRPVTF